MEQVNEETEVMCAVGKYLFYDLDQKELGMMWMKKAAQRGHAQAQIFMGCEYDSGIRMTQNLEEAAKWWRQAAAQGHAQAQHNLAVAYDKGEGVTQNKEEAVKWFRQAAAQGDAQAQCNLALAYFKGEGVTQNLKEAVYWLDKAADANYPPAAIIRIRAWPLSKLLSLRHKTIGNTYFNTDSRSLAWSF